MNCHLMAFRDELMREADAITGRREDEDVQMWFLKLIALLFVMYWVGEWIGFYWDKWKYRHY